VVVENAREPVADWLPTVFPFVIPFPSWNKMPVNGLAVDVPLPVTPVMLMDATVLLLTLVVVPVEMPLKAMPTNFAPVPAPVNV
jgi:hypothetical protein